jgi:hypothetical protein
MANPLALAPLALLPLLEPVELDASSEFHRYDCAPQLALTGPEHLRWIELEAPGLLRAEVEDSAAELPWLLLLRDPGVEDGEVSGCVAHGQGAVTLREAEAGRYLLVLEGSPGAGAAAPLLAAEALPAGAWARRELAPGILWERRWDPAGPQTVNVLRVAPEARGALRPVRHEGCETVPAVGARLGALAGINAAFFSKACQPLCLLMADGEALATGAMGKGALRSLGWSAGGEPRWAWVDDGEPWRGVDVAVAGYPSLVRAGEVQVDPAISTPFAQQRHPRSAVGLTADGALLLVTVDGRTAAGAGMTLPELAAQMRDLGAVNALNLDGGGSTTLWVRGAWLDGVTNHPSDNLQPDHHGARAVSDGLYLLPVAAPGAPKAE